MTTQKHFLSLSEIRNKFEEIDRKLSFQKKRLDWTQGFIVAILVICFLAFLGFLYDYFKFTYEYRQRLYDKLEQKDKEINAINFHLDTIKKDKLQFPHDTTIKK